MILLVLLETFPSENFRCVRSLQRGKVEPSPPEYAGTDLAQKADAPLSSRLRPDCRDH